MGKGISSVKFGLFVLLFVQLCCARSWAVDEARAKNYAQDPRGIVRVDVLGYENDLEAGGDPSALIGSIEAEGTCLTYVFDSEKSFAYKVRLALEDAEGTTYVPIIDVNPGSPTGGVDRGCPGPIVRPIAVDDTYGENYAGKNVLSNDRDLNNLPLTAVLATQPRQGTVTLDPNGSFVYTPNAGATGDDSFTYFANNGTYNSKAAATVSLTIMPPPLPVAVDDSYGIEYAGKNVLSNDTDPSDLPLSAVINTQPRKGTVTLDPDGTFVYTPNAGATGDDSFTYFANNGISNSEMAATVSLTIDIDPPIAVDDNYGTSYVGKNVLSNDTDANDLPLTAVLDTQPRQGTVTLDPDGTFVYTPNVGATGADSFTYFANNGTYNSEMAATVSLTIDIDPPIAVDDNYGTSYVGKNVLSNDTDANDLPLTAVLDTQPRQGNVTLDPDGTFVYTPNDGATGSDSFTYFANNGTYNSETAATVSLSILAIVPPIAVNDTYGADYTGKNVLSNDTDVNDLPLTAVLDTQPRQGTVTLDPDGSFVYTPNADATGDDSFTYFANNGTYNSETAATVSLTIPDIKPPVANNDNYGIDYAGKNVLSNDTDPNDLKLTAVLDTPPQNGTVKLNSDGTFNYTPNTGFTGEDSFTYKANNGSADSNVAKVSLEVKDDTNGVPVARPDSFGENYTGKSVLTNDSDPNGQALTAVEETRPEGAEFKLNSDGTFVFKPYAGFTGEASFTYKARNTSGLESEVVSVTLDVTAEPETDITGKEDPDGYSVLGNASSNEIKVSMRIDQICPKLEPSNAGQSDLKELCSRLRGQGTTARQAVDALGAITPEELAAIPQTARIVTLMRSRNTGARLMRVREGEKGISVSGLNISHGNNQMAGGDLDRMLNEFLGSLGGGASADGYGDLGNLGIFIQGDLSFGDRDETGLQSGYDYDAQNIALGADYRFGDIGFAGASVSYAWSTVDFDDNAGKTEADSIALAVFGSYYLGDNGYIDGTFSYDWSDIKTRRNIRYTDYLGSVDRQAKGDTDGTGYYISLNAGYGFHWGGFNFIPGLSFFYLDGDVDSFQEKGAGGWDLAVEDQGFKSTSIEFSTQLSYAFSTDWGVLSPYVRMGYNREFEDSAEGIRFRFVNDPDGNNPGGNIRIQSEDPDDTFMMYAAGATAQFKYGISGFVSYQLLGSYDNLSSETVSFGMRWETAF